MVWLADTCGSSRCLNDTGSTSSHPCQRSLMMRSTYLPMARDARETGVEVRVMRDMQQVLLLGVE